MRASTVFRYIILPLVTFVVSLSAKPAYAQAGQQSVGLVLSGGGAKGIAHIGALKALEENDIPVDYITGTSMGAIVGGLYACGFSPDDMMELLTSEYFLSMAAGRYDPSLTYYFSREAPSPQMFSVSLGGNDGTHRGAFNFDPQSLISPTPMSFGFMELFTPYTAQCGGDFDHLMVPFRCVASNVTRRRKEVLGSGSLGDAIRASMSFPLVFQPVKEGPDILYDGGLYDNFPVNVMDSVFAPDVLLGVDVSAPSEGAPNSFMEQLDLLVSHPQSYDVPADKGIKLRIDLNEYTLLDFGQAREIYRIGYEHAMAAMDSIKSRVSARMAPGAAEARRTAFNAATPPLRFNKVKVSGGTHAQNEYLRYIFSPRHGADTIGPDGARMAFYRAMSSGKINSIRPFAKPSADSTGYFTLNLDVNVKKKFSLGLGGYITSSNNSYLYARIGYSSLSFSAVSTDFETWIGQSYLAAAFRASLNIPTPFPSAFRVLGVASRRKYYENEKLFYRDNEPTFVTKHQYFGKLAWAMAAGRSGALQIGVGGARLYSTFFENNKLASYVAGRNELTLDLGQGYVDYSSSTLDYINFPTSGYERSGRIALVGGRARYYDAILEPGQRTSSEKVLWGQIDLNVRQYLTLHRHWSLGLESKAVFSTRKLLRDYYSTISSAPSFHPTPASHNVFDPGLRANSFLAFGVVPVCKFSDQLSLHLTASGFVPLRTIVEGQEGSVHYGRWLGSAEFFGELTIVSHFPFGTLSGYSNYSTTRRDFNFGIAFGIYINAPTFLN